MTKPEWLTKPVVWIPVLAIVLIIFAAVLTGLLVEDAWLMAMIGGLSAIFVVLVVALVWTLLSREREDRHDEGVNELSDEAREALRRMAGGHMAFKQVAVVGHPGVAGAVANRHTQLAFKGTELVWMMAGSVDAVLGQVVHPLGAAATGGRLLHIQVEGGGIRFCRREAGRCAP